MGVRQVLIAQLSDLGLKNHGGTTLLEIVGHAARSSSSPNPRANQTSPPGWTANATIESGTSISRIAGPPS
jgi:hypothetical protein